MSATATSTQNDKVKVAKAEETDYRALYCRLAEKAVKDLTVEEHAAIRLWRLADEFKDQGYTADTIRVCNACGKASPWKKTEQRYVQATWWEWWRNTVWEKEHLVDGDGWEHGRNPKNKDKKQIPSGYVAVHICYQ